MPSILVTQMKRLKGPSDFLSLSFFSRGVTAEGRTRGSRMSLPLNSLLAASYVRRDSKGFSFVPTERAELFLHKLVLPSLQTWGENLVFPTTQFLNVLTLPRTKLCLSLVHHLLSSLICVGQGVVTWIITYSETWDISTAVGLWRFPLFL